MKFHRRRDTVDAPHYIGVNEQGIAQFAGGDGRPYYMDGAKLMIPVGGRVGVLIVPVGDWVVKLPDDSVAVVTDEKFNALYEPAEKDPW